MAPDRHSGQRTAPPPDQIPREERHEKAVRIVLIAPPLVDEVHGDAPVEDGQERDEHQRRHGERTPCLEKSRQRRRLGDGGRRIFVEFCGHDRRLLLRKVHARPVASQMSDLFRRLEASSFRGARRKLFSDRRGAKLAGVAAHDTPRTHYVRRRTIRVSESGRCHPD